ncbi:hypothetical protein OA331_04580 [Bacteroidota bacterium]|nr:hypothetical protein [Bacteroidota bacterium]
MIEIYSIDCKLLSGEIDSAIFPGSDGSFQVLNNHAPIVSTLTKGKIEIQGEISFHAEDSRGKYNINKEKKATSLQIESGLVELKKNSIKVLID